ncbi:MAG TPA: sodium-independent anion transporter, partial [Solirubrobacteraceae bacterium]|nr:sodium-independent anion transporter [Solirubrobacteraceae bacterium]
MPMWYANADRFRSELDAVLDGRHEPVHAIVLDVVGMTDLDYTASQVLGRLLDELGRRHIALFLARVEPEAGTNLRRSGLLARIGPDHVFPSVDEAVAAAQGGRVGAGA